MEATFNTVRRFGKAHLSGQGMLPGLAFAALIVLMDQATKWVVMDAVLGGPSRVQVFAGFDLVWVWNTGVSFGMFGGMGIPAWGFAVFSFVVAGFLVVWLRTTDTWLMSAAVAIVIGGAVGNAIDRLRFGAVFDFVRVYADGSIGGVIDILDTRADGMFDWPAFNVADAAITIGVTLLIVDAIFRKNPDTEPTSDR